jgi:hypothetical protein
MTTEKVPLFLIYKQDGQIKTDVSKDINDYELYGFLKLFIDRMEKELKDLIEDREDKEEIL